MRRSWSRPRRVHPAGIPVIRWRYSRTAVRSNSRAPLSSSVARDPVLENGTLRACTTGRDRPQRVLFIHQNFPGQFGHVARALAAAGHEVVALGITARQVAGVRVHRYMASAPERGSLVEVVRDFESKVVRGLACAGAMKTLCDEGFRPDTIVAHPGWGEALFCKDVWPAARLLVFAEFFYGADGTDFGFDPEFSQVDLRALQRLRLKNSTLLHALTAADGGYAPTRWQHSRIPAPLQNRFQVAFDGVDTTVARPDPAARVGLQRAGVRLAAGDEVLTFVNRNLEPYRGFHVFMRALPQILRQRPRAHALIVGGNDVSYGARPRGGGNWRDRMLAEVGAELPRERVHLLGHLPYAEYLQVLQVSACHVYLTYPFVLSWSCVEALSTGCVVVGSRTPPVEEFIEHGRNGLLVDFFDVAGLARQVCDVLENRDRFSDLRARARQDVVDRYDLRAQCLPRLASLILGKTR
ncbi:MAG: glycosyltransferase [Burkholderiaceae bacterium]|nr:glycosyltransferase [Burkholderiaceae bacterium]